MQPQGAKAVAAPTRLAARRPRVFYGWWIVLAGLSVNYYIAGTFWYGFTSFFTPISDEFHWSRAVVSTAFAIQSSEGAVIGPFAGFALDRFGPRRVMLAGITVTGLGFIALSAINSLWSFYLSFIVISLGLSFGSFLVFSTAINSWFNRRKGRAMAVMSLGAGLGSTLAPVLVLFIDHFGWRDALLMIGIGLWVVGIPAALVMRRSPEEHGMSPDGDEAATVPGLDGDGSTVAYSPGWPHHAGPLQEEEGPTLRQALRSRAFWQIAIASSLGMMVIGGIIVHMIPALVSFGLTRTQGGFIITIMGISSLTGRFFGGTMGDYVDKRKVMAVGFTLMFIGGMLFINIHSFWQAVLFAVIFGPGFGAIIPTRPALQGEYFGRAVFGRLMGIMYTVTAAPQALSPVFAGWMFDNYESYRLAFFILALPAIVAIALYLTLKRPQWALPQDGSAKAAPKPDAGY